MQQKFAVWHWASALQLVRHALAPQMKGVQLCVDGVLQLPAPLQTAESVCTFDAHDWLTHVTELLKAHAVVDEPLHVP